MKTENLPEQTIVVNCFGCKRPLTVDMTPQVVAYPDGYYTVAPCPTAPHVCNTCRQDRHIMKAARRVLKEEHEDVPGHADSRRVKLERIAA